MQNRKGDWIQTYTGKRFYPLDPRPEDIDIQDIAVGLARRCRFSGQTRQYYSVAQHCILVSHLCPPEFALCGLLHDASEAYLADVPRPLKRFPEFAFYRQAEERIEQAVALRFGLPYLLQPAVKEADNDALRGEAQTLMTPLLPGWEEWITVPPKWLDDHTIPGYPTVYMPALSAEALFLRRFQKLTCGRATAA